MIEKILRGADIFVEQGHKVQVSVSHEGESQRAVDFLPATPQDFIDVAEGVPVELVMERLNKRATGGGA